MSLIHSPSPRLALEFIKGSDKDADAMAVDTPADNKEAATAEDAPPAEAALAEGEEAKEA